MNYFCNIPIHHVPEQFEYRALPDQKQYDMHLLGTKLPISFQLIIVPCICELWLPKVGYMLANELKVLK